MDKAPSSIENIQKFYGPDTLPAIWWKSKRESIYRKVHDPVKDADAIRILWLAMKSYNRGAELKRIQKEEQKEAERAAATAAEAETEVPAPAVRFANDIIADIHPNWAGKPPATRADHAGKDAANRANTAGDTPSGAHQGQHQARGQGKNLSGSAKKRMRKQAAAGTGN